jgi:hypothetical protein
MCKPRDELDSDFHLVRYRDARTGKSGGFQRYWLGESQPAGKLEVEEAEINGIYEGELTVCKRLLVRGSGRVSGTVRYGQLEIERGGRLSGSFLPLGDELGDGA